MKKYFPVFIISLVVFSCKKQSPGDAPPAVHNDPHTLSTNVNAYLKNNLSASDFNTVDTSAIVLSEQPGAWFVRVGLTGKKMGTDFILLQADTLGNFTSGKFVHIKRDSALLSAFNGIIATESLQHAMPLKRLLTNNTITKQSLSATTTNIMEDDDDDWDIVPSDDCPGCLPLVVVVGYSGSSGSAGTSSGLSFADYINLLYLSTGSSSSPGSLSPSAIYSLINIPSGGSNPTATKVPGSMGGDLLINFEASASKPGIDVNAYMKCFAAIPDAGAICSVTIYTDLPVNDNPSYIFNILTGATGHAFLQLTKTGGAQSVTQIIGKTTSKPLAVLGFPVAGKIVDNSLHKYNASLTMKLTPVQLQTEINTVISIGSNPSYDMWENNCVDYALDILNAVRPSNPINVGMSIDPSTGDAYQTPQSLYIALDYLKRQNGADAANITMDIVRNVSTSHGSCAP